jgi:glycosyltransferase involved in cell wall biosynthesis
MKVVQILYSGLGGHGSVAFSLVHAASSHWNHGIVLVGIEPVLGEYEERCRKRDIPWRHVRTRPGRAFAAWPSVFAALRQLAPDAIILHSVKAILPCALYARSRGIPLVAVEHQPNALKKRSEWWVGRALMRWADAVVVLTPEYLAELSEGLGGAFREEKARLIPNGIDTGFFCPKTGLRPNGPKKIGMAARFSETKRQDLLVEALKRLLQMDGLGSWTLSLAGDGQTRPSVERLVGELGLTRSVETPGFIRGEQLRDWLQGLDFYVHATQGETLSTSLLQAMATGLPIVGSDVEGVRNLLSLEGGCGLLAPAQSAEAFAEALADLATDRTETERLSANAKRLAEERFSNQAMFEAYDRLIQECMQDRLST